VSSNKPAMRSDQEIGSPQASPSDVNVLYIAGWGRSGSTLLDRILGQIPDFVSVGEIREMWRSGCVENRDCGCGKPFSECPFWNEVGTVAFGGWSKVPLVEIIRLRYALDRAWMTPLLALPVKPRSLDQQIQRYVSFLGELYRAIHKVSGAKVIIDSSNLASHALLLRMIPGINLKIAHLIRDSRGVAFSWTKAIVRHVTEEETTYLPRYNALASSLRWTMYNTLASSLRGCHLSERTVRYEDVMKAPGQEVRQLVEFAGRPSSDLSFINDRTVTLDVGHTVDGNSMRFALGEVPLRTDEKWRSKMSRVDKWTVTAATLPLLARYGYFRSRQAAGV
jgi:Sulfotransferase family